MIVDIPLRMPTINFESESIAFRPSGNRHESMPSKFSVEKLFDKCVLLCFIKPILGNQ